MCKFFVSKKAKYVYAAAAKVQGIFFMKTLSALEMLVHHRNLIFRAMKDLMIGDSSYEFNLENGKGLITLF